MQHIQHSVDHETVGELCTLHTGKCTYSAFNVSSRWQFNFFVYSTTNKSLNFQVIRLSVLTISCNLFKVQICICRWSLVHVLAFRVSSARFKLCTCSTCIVHHIEPAFCSKLIRASQIWWYHDPIVPYVSPLCAMALPLEYSRFCWWKEKFLFDFCWYLFLYLKCIIMYHVINSMDWMFQPRRLI